jgi:tryptophanyl-tRNA synthetase
MGSVAAASLVYSAVQSSGRLHLGNYLGALKQWVGLQHSVPPRPLVFAVADLHSLTGSSADAAEPTAAAETMRSLLAVGLNPERAVLYRQSDLAGQHATLMWLLSCSAATPLLQRMVHYKDKAGAWTVDQNFDSLF